MQPVDLDGCSAAEGSLHPNYQPRSTPGGIVYEPMTYNKEILRSELIEIANQVSFQHAARIVDKILARYDVKRKPLKEKK